MEDSRVFHLHFLLEWCFFSMCAFLNVFFPHVDHVFESFIVGDDSIKKVSLQDFQGYAMNRQRLNSKEPLFVYKC